MFTLTETNNHEQIAFASILFGSLALSTIICTPLLVVAALFALAFAGVVFGIVSAIQFEAIELDLYTPKADSAFVAHITKKQAQMHSAKTKYAMQRAKQQKQTIELWAWATQECAELGLALPLNAKTRFN